MTVTPLEDIPGIVAAAREAFDSGVTRSRASREQRLRALRDLLVTHEDELLGALAADLGKPRMEAWAMEVGFVIGDIDHTLSHLATWMKPERVQTPVTFQPGSSKIVREPLGVATVIAPWNYPVQLLLAPVVAAIAAGNAVVAKPSEVTPTVDEVLGRLLRGLGDPAIQVVHGGVAETTALLEQKVDSILYTGNGRVGRIVMKAAAEHLTPVTLELGGKSPAVVTRHADLKVAARRIVWGKFVNAGQTCIAPDHVLVEEQVHDELVRQMCEVVKDFYGDDPQSSADYGRIVSDVHFSRVEKLLHDGTVVAGGTSDPDTRYVAPTIVTDVTPDSPSMQDEIFGPVLPVLRIADVDQAVRMIRAGDKPLALYVFTESDDEVDDLVARTSSGGVTVNGTILHVSAPDLPFGGVGPSGMGAYHGHAGFETFSHRRSVHTRSTRLDPPVLYPPYTRGKEKLLRRAVLAGDPRRHLSRLRGALGRSN